MLAARQAGCNTHTQGGGAGRPLPARPVNTPGTRAALQADNQANVSEGINGPCSLPGLYQLHD